VNNQTYEQLLQENISVLQEDMLSLLKAASKSKKEQDQKAAQQAAKAVAISTPQQPTQQTDFIDSDMTHLEPVSDSSLISADDNRAGRNTNGSKLYNDLAPEVMVANSIITSIYNSFVDNCNNSKKMKDYFAQVKNWEKEARGACQQVISIIEASNFDTKNTAICSPKAYKTIVNYLSRDRSAIDLCAAIIIFRNSLKKD